MPEWLHALLIGTVILGLVGAIWGMHEKRDREREQASKDRDEALWLQLGKDSHSGMRKTVHDAYNMGLSNKGLIERLEDRVKEIAGRVFGGKS